MRKFGLTLLTLTIALAACAEAPTAASAVDAGAAMDGYVVGSGNYEEENPGFGGSGNVTTAENPGLLGSGHVTTPDAEATAGAENPGLAGSGHVVVAEPGMTVESTSGGPGFLGSGH
jgi:hypothetical protein